MKLINNYILPFFRLWMHFGFLVAWNEACFVLNRKKHPMTYGTGVTTYRKYYHIVKILSKKYKTIIDKYTDIPENEWNGGFVEADCPIWFFWYQGMEQAPLVVKACLESVKKNAGQHPVIILDENNLYNYITLPDNIRRKFETGIFTFSLLSDLVRFKLLDKYGGIWTDACNFFLKDTFFKTATQHHFYSVRGFDNDFKITRQLWSDGILACGKGNAYPRMMSELLQMYCEKEVCLIDYFVSSCFQNAAYIRSFSLRKMFDSYAYNNIEYFSIRWNFGTDYDESVYERIIASSSVVNLTWRIDICSKETYFKHLLDLLNT